VTSPYTVAAYGPSGVWPQFAEAVFISGRGWTELRQPGRVRAGYFDYLGRSAGRQRATQGRLFTVPAVAVAAWATGNWLRLEPEQRQASPADHELGRPNWQCCNGNGCFDS